LNCWIYENKKCDEDCAAFLKLDSGDADALIHGVPLWSQKEPDFAEMRTYCALISPIWQMGESMNQISIILKEYLESIEV